MARPSVSSARSAQEMLIREAQRAYREFYARCFCSYSPTLKIELGDVAWVAEQLRQHGGLDAWHVAAALMELSLQVGVTNAVESVGR